VALDAEGVREAEGDSTVVLVAHLDGAAHGVLCRWEVPEVALEVEERATRHQRDGEVGGRDGGRRPEMGGHGALGVARHEHEAAAGAEIAS